MSELMALAFAMGFYLVLLNLISRLMKRRLSLIESCILGFLCGIVIGHIARADVTNPKFKIAIVDTGYNPKFVPVGHEKLKLCSTGHFDFTSGKNQVGSNLEHGTYVATIIADELKDVDYCAVIFNVYHPKNDENKMPTEDIVSAFFKAKDENVQFVNASYDTHLSSVAEREAMKDFTKSGRQVFVAAGNHSLNLDYECLAFPACFDIPNTLVVGALKPDRSGRMFDSNYGSKVVLWFNGDFLGLEQGTSFAAPRALASRVYLLAQQQGLMITKKPLDKLHLLTTNTQDLTPK